MSEGSDFIWGWELLFAYCPDTKHQPYLMREVERLLRNLSSYEVTCMPVSSKEVQVEFKGTKGSILVSRKGSKTPWNKKQYVKVDLSADERKDVMSLVKQGDVVLSLLDEAIGAGYVFRIANDEKTERVKVTVDGDGTLHNKGLILENAASDVRLAVCSALYKVVTKCGLLEWRTESLEGSWFD